MDTNEIRGLLKGLGIGIILCTAVFYLTVLNLRTTYEDAYLDSDRIIESAKGLGMVFPSQQLMDDEDVIEAARKLGMVFEAEREE